MEKEKKKLNFLNFKWRKIIHYSLILCILLIQLIIAAFFYNEYISKENIKFLNKQLKEVGMLEDLTNTSKQDLVDAQSFFQKYITTEDDKYLNSYFNSVNNLTQNLERINKFKEQNPRFNTILSSQKISPSQIKNLKLLIDSTYQISSQSDFNLKTNIPELKRYQYDYNFVKEEVQTQHFSDTVVKKGIFGRLRDAISGKVNVKKDSTIVTVKKSQEAAAAKMKAEVDSIINAMNNLYSKDVQQIKLNVIKTKDNSGRFYSTFNNLLVYSNELMGLYDAAVKNTKVELQKEFNKENSKANKIRDQLVLSLMILMFIVSIIIMYFTRMAFLYEWKLKEANNEIKENLNFKNRILGMLSHELRSPLKIIGIFINRIDKKNTDENIKEYLKSISFTNNTLLMQANQILEYTKNQQVENKLICTEFNLYNEINSIFTAIEPYVKTRNNEFITKKSIDPNLIVYSDNTKINQIFMNIIGNANKFTENGKISVEVFADFIDNDAVRLTSKISDTGAGISTSDLEKIFEPYYQGVLSDEVENLGAGLGLSLCKEIIELYSGSISIESEQGKGTNVTFIINLELKK